jgi:thiamine pyrophosphokinase
MKAIVAASGTVAEADADLLAGADLVIGADGGAAALDRFGRRPDLVVGDMDSLDPELLDRLAAAGTGVERHPADKEASDTELALDAAVARGAETIVLVGATGGSRLDHELANLLLLVEPRFVDRHLVAMHDGTRIRALLPGRPMRLDGKVGDFVSLLPVSEDVRGVTTSGLRWPLSNDRLALGRSRGLSNVIAEHPATVRSSAGALLVVETPARKDRT